MILNPPAGSGLNRNLPSVTFKGTAEMTTRKREEGHFSVPALIKGPFLSETSGARRSYEPPIGYNNKFKSR